MLKKPTLPLTTARAAAAAAAAVSSTSTTTKTTTLCGGRVGVSASLGGSIMCFPTTGVSGTSSTSANGAKHDKHGVGATGTNNGLCGCHKAPKSYCISATGVLLLVLLYTALGSIVFVTLEGELEDSGSMETAVAASKPYPHTELANAEIRSRTVDRLWSITEDLNILYKENWTRLAAQEVQHFQDTLLRAARQSKIYQTGAPMSTPAHKWTYASAFLYSLTLITTIGYGGISPRTQWGRIAALVYALFGIPIVLLYLSAMGEGLSAAMRCIFRRGRRSSKAAGGSLNNNSSSVGGKLSDGNKAVSGGKLHTQHPYAALPKSTYNMPVAARSSSVPISVCVMVLICYVCAGAVLFHKVQNWSILEALYFCFTSLGTIGFGELTPTGNLTIYLASAYILIGMAVVAMCFSLIQTEILMWLRRFSVQDHVMPTKTEDVALVSVAVTPKSS